MEVNKHKNLDQVFQDKLQNIEVAPPAHIWEGIQASGINKSNSWRWWAMAGIITAILGTASYFYFSTNSPNSEQSLSKQNIETVDHQTLESTIQEATSSEINDISEDTEQEIVEELQRSFPIEKQVEEQITQVPITSENVNDNSSTDDEATNLDSEEFIKTTFDGETINSLDALVNIDNSNDLPTNINSEKAAKAGFDFFDDDAMDKVMRGHNEFKRWELGIEFSPEWVTIPENDNNIESYGIDLSARYHFSKWFVESGIGAAISKDDGIYGVDYIETQFKGSYHDVYNVTFDTTDGEITPTYHTKLINVYDSIDKYTVTENKNTYGYINIPLNVGYNTQLGEKFAFYVKTGLIGSFRIYKDIPAPKVNGTLVKYTPLYHQRTDWHLQAQLNAGVHYYITEKFLFGVEPNIRYYLKSLVETNNGGNPYGFGVKIGFKYVIKK